MCGQAWPRYGRLSMIGLIGTVNLFDRRYQAAGQSRLAVYIIAAMLLISAQTRNLGAAPDRAIQGRAPSFGLVFAAALTGRAVSCTRLPNADIGKAEDRHHLETGAIAHAGLLDRDKDSNVREQNARRFLPFDDAAHSC